MKRILLFISLSVSALQLSAQTPGLSPLTRQYLEQQKSGATTPAGYLYKTTPGGNLLLAAMIKVNDAAKAESGLKAAGAVIGTKAGNIWTIKVPADKMGNVSTLPGIAYIQLDEPVAPQLNIARKTTRVDSVHSGINLPQRFSGKGVVVGIIDFGFDYQHPTFYDTTGVYRVKKVWELDGIGTPPAGYNYGRELADTNAIKAATTDNHKQTHGSGVAGLAAGSGWGSGNSNYRGMAYNADLVFVCVRRDSIAEQWLKGGFSDFLDGINYIFKYAESVGKPAVVNISWGSQSGPHDGSNLFNQACDNMSGSGKIIVMSAGNDGERKIHLSKTFTATDTVLNTFLNFTPAIYKRTWVDIWGEAGKTFCGDVTLYKNGIKGRSTGFTCIDDLLHTNYLIGANDTDTCFVQFITSSAEYNGKPRTTITIYNKAADSMGITIKGNSGSIHLWNEYYYYGYTYGYQSEFNSHGYSWAVTGNNTTTVSDMGSAQSVLLVGAYCSKNAYTDINNNPLSYGGYVGVGKLVPFSSIGPMTDGRIKPDITAPGLTIATAYNSFDSVYSPTGASSQQIVSQVTHPVSGKTYYYGEFTGTSASAPIASGIVALMLEANPSLWPDQLKDILTQTAIKDNHTGTIPAGGNNTWGQGKINAYGAVRMAIQQVGMYHFNGEKMDCILYPNPTNGSLTLDYNGINAEELQIEVFNSNGATVLAENWSVSAGQNLHNIDLSGLAKGIYLVRLVGVAGNITTRLIVQ